MSNYRMTYNPKFPSMKAKTLIIISIGIIFFMLAPLIFALGYEFIMEQQGHTINEGDNSVYAFGWYSFVTIPIGLFAFLILAIIIIINKYRSK